MSRGCLVQQGKRALKRSIATRGNSTLKPSQNVFFPSTSFYRITPSTQTQVVSHDVKAASITKALYIDCLPPGAEREKDPEFYKTFKKTIFESFFFEPSERQPKKSQTRKSNVTIAESILSQLLRYYLTKVDTTKCKVMVDREPYLEFPFYRTLPESSTPVPFLVQGHLTYNLLSNTLSRPLFTPEQCEQTRDHAVVWDDVIATTLDIEQASVLDNILPGGAASCLPSYPYTRLLLDIAPGDQWSDTARARGVYFLFARLASEAVRDGYRPGDTLSTPRVGVFISSSAYSFHYIFYQLNTLDLMTEGGVKNLAWGRSVDNITTNLVPFKKVEPENLLGPAVLEQVVELAKAAMFHDTPTREDRYVQ